MKFGKPLQILACAGVLAFSASARADVITYEFSFTGADLMNAAYTAGADGSSAADNGLFDGARLRRNGTSPGAGSSRSYVASQHTDFTNWRTTTTDRYIGFNLWGLDGRGVNWGEDYKPLSWGSTTSAAGWSSVTYTWPASWGPVPAGAHTPDFIGWEADSFADGMTFADAGLAALAFTFQVDFDTDDMFWGADTNGAPNTLPELTFWFGGYFDDDFYEDDNNYYIYEGNLTLTGRQIPEPGTLTLLATGLIGLGALRRRRRG